MNLGTMCEICEWIHLDMNMCVSIHVQDGGLTKKDGGWFILEMDGDISQSKMGLNLNIKYRGNHIYKLAFITSY